MLSRRRDQIVLLAGLIVLNALLAWDGHGLWRDYQRRTQWIYAPAVPGPSSAPAARPPTPPAAQNFAEIVNRNMFTPERTSQSPQQDVKAPDLPQLYGTMNLGQGWFAVMAPGDPASAGLSKRVQVGEEIGGYKLVDISGSQVVVEWNQQKFNLDAANAVRRPPRAAAETTRTEGAAASRAPTSAAGGNETRVTTVGSSPFTPYAPGSQRQKGNPPPYSAPPGAPPDAPAGTVFAGKRKVVNPTPFGDQVVWVDADPTQNSAGQTQKEK